MVKITKEHSVTPKKIPIRPWGYTRREGGDIYRFSFPDSQSAMDRMETEVTNPLRWNTYPGPNPEGGMSRHYTIIRIVPELPMMKAFAVYFPDGRVWDSHLRDFRKIRDYEQRG